MKICDFCLQLRYDGTCELGLRLPKQMRCREFDPGIEKFCSDPRDFVSESQIAQMATFFGIKGAELKKIKLMPLKQEHSTIS
jgi:hypothetical protein